MASIPHYIWLSVKVNKAKLTTLSTIFIWFFFVWFNSLLHNSWHNSSTSYVTIKRLIAISFSTFSAHAEWSMRPVCYAPIGCPTKMCHCTGPNLECHRWWSLRAVPQSNANTLSTCRPLGSTGSTVRWATCKRAVANCYWSMPTQIRFPCTPDWCRWTRRIRWPYANRTIWSLSSDRTVDRQSVA